MEKAASNIGKYVRNDQLLCNSYISVFSPTLASVYTLFLLDITIYRVIRFCCKINIFIHNFQMIVLFLHYQGVFKIFNLV